MNPIPESTESPIRPLVEQLYESEGLTDALTDAAATLLLHWGEQQLQHLAHLKLNQTDLAEAAHGLQRAMRTVNQLMAQRANLGDTEMVELLLRLIDQVIALTLIAQKPNLPDNNYDQET